MGVKHFYLWYSRQFSHCLSDVPQYPVDNLALDLNGLFHPVAQKVFQYGNSRPQHRFLSQRHPPRPHRSMLHLFKEICEKIETCRQVCRPRKRLILCVDGVAGLGKMNQQRQRRFRTAKSLEENTDQSFNPNAFTPGTKLMDHLTKYIDWYVRTMMSYHPDWRHLEIIFSNEKVPGEGEHKIMQYIRQHGPKGESYCIYGLDADLIMLGMMLPVEKVMIAREADENLVQYVDVSSFRKEIMSIMRWSSGSTADPSLPFEENDAIHDFIMLCFLVGNDFLPTVPSLTIIDGAINLMMDTYKKVGKEHGHLTRTSPTSTNIEMRLTALTAFFRELGSVEKSLIEKKYRGKVDFFPDPLVIQNMSGGNLNMEKFKQDYYEKNLPGISLEELVKNYLDGSVWVMNYYKSGIPDWLWYFPYLYGPFLSDFAEVLRTYRMPVFEQHAPVPPFLQLMMVLPSSSADLVPEGLSELMTKTDSPLFPYYPVDFQVDMAGKKRDWEGIVLLPPAPVSTFMEVYRKKIRDVQSSLLKRNIKGKNFIYRHNASTEKPFLSFYGNIENCTVECTPITF